MKHPESVMHCASIPEVLEWKGWPAKFSNARSKAQIIYFLQLYSFIDGNHSVNSSGHVCISLFRYIRLGLNAHFLVTYGHWQVKSPCVSLQYFVWRMSIHLNKFYISALASHFFFLMHGWFIATALSPFHNACMSPMAAGCKYHSRFICNSRCLPNASVHAHPWCSHYYLWLPWTATKAIKITCSHCLAFWGSTSPQEFSMWGDATKHRAWIYTMNLRPKLWYCGLWSSSIKNRECTKCTFHAWELLGTTNMLWSCICGDWAQSDAQETVHLARLPAQYVCLQ